MKELENLKNRQTKDRFYKVGDVVRFISTYNLKLADQRGLGVVVEAKGPKFKVYWDGKRDGC